MGMWVSSKIIVGVDITNYINDHLNDEDETYDDFDCDYCDENLQCSYRNKWDNDDFFIIGKEIYQNQENKKEIDIVDLLYETLSMKKEIKELIENKLKIKINIDDIKTYHTQIYE